MCTWMCQCIFKMLLKAMHACSYGLGAISGAST
jgi:hypothetical protein